MGSHPYLEQTQQLRDGDREGVRRLVEEATKQGNASVYDLYAVALVLDEKRLREEAMSLLKEVLRREPTAAEPACVLAYLDVRTQAEALDKIFAEHSPR